MNTDNIDNGNDTQKLKSNVNYNDIDSNSSIARSKAVDVIADKLMLQLDAKPESRAFICKVAWKLPEFRIWSNVEQALKGKNPMGLFIYLCKKDGV